MYILLDIMKDDGFDLKRLTIPLSVQDYDTLYQIQQGYLFSGKSIGNIWQLGDIFKAVIFYGGIKMMPALDNVMETSYQLIPFLDNHKISHSILPKTSDEFIEKIRKHTTNEIIDDAIKNIQNGEKSNKEISEAIKKLKDIMNEPGDSFSSNKSTNFTINFTHGESSAFMTLKSFIEAYVGEITNAEMARTMFRNNTTPRIVPSTGINSQTHGIRKNNYYILEFVFIIYFGSLYDIPPQEAVQLFFGLETFFDNRLSEKTLDKIKWLDRDKVIMENYLKELENGYHELHKKNTKSTLRNIKKALKDYDDGYQLTYINMNRSREDLFKSAIANFSFHSAFIGCYMLAVEWINQLHKIPLIAAYVYPKDLHFANRYFESEALDAFNSILARFYELSERYRNTGKLVSQANPI